MQIEFFFDVVSPFSYLASTQVDGLAERTGVEVCWRPFYLGGLFNSIGNQPPAMLAARGRYMGNDLKRWASHYGVPYSFPSKFPTHSLRAMRMCIAAEQPALVAKKLFEAYWVRNEDISDEAVLRSIDEALFDMAVEPTAKEALKESTRSAEERGVFGAPTFFVGKEMYFGNDRLAFVEAAAKEAR